MAKDSVILSIKTTAETASKPFGRCFMKRLIDEDRRLTPEWVSTSERFKDTFTGLEEFTENWWALPTKKYINNISAGESILGPHWKRKKSLRSRGHVTHGFNDVRGQRFPSALWFQSHYDKKVDFYHLFCEWVDLAQPIVAMLHLFAEAERSFFEGEDYSWFENGSFGGAAKPGLPNIGWAMAYGQKYASGIDTALIAAAGFPVSVTGEVIIVRVTESLADVSEDFGRFSQRRAELKRQFPPDLFWIKHERSMVLDVDD